MNLISPIITDGRVATRHIAPTRATKPAIVNPAIESAQSSPFAEAAWPIWRSVVSRQQSRGLGL